MFLGIGAALLGIGGLTMMGFLIGGEEASVDTTPDDAFDEDGDEVLTIDLGTFLEGAETAEPSDIDDHLDDVAAAGDALTDLFDDLGLDLDLEAFDAATQGGTDLPDFAGLEDQVLDVLQDVGNGGNIGDAISALDDVLDEAGFDENLFGIDGLGLTSAVSLTRSSVQASVAEIDAAEDETDAEETPFPPILDTAARAQEMIDARDRATLAEI
ncbi:MAG: hypothetical protein ACU0CO_17885 [Shimia sp.]